MSDFLTDEEMQALEADSSSDFMSDEEMAKLEADNQKAVKKTLSAGQYSLPEAAIAATAQGLSLGSSDELIAAGRTGSFTSPEYLREADRQSLRQEDIRNQYPTLYDWLTLGGATATNMMAPGAGRVSGAMATGALQGLGLSEKRLATDPVGLASDAGLQGATSGAFQYGFNRAANTLSPNKLREAATFRANKAATGEQMADLRVQSKKAPRDEAGNIIPEAQRDPAEMIGGRLARRGEDLLEKDEAGPAAVRAGDKWDDVFPRAVAKRNYFGQRIRDAIVEADQAGVTVDGREIAQRILRMVDDIPEDSASRGKIQAALDVAAEFERMGQIPFSRAQKHKENYVYKPENVAPLSMGAQLTNGVNRAISDAMEQAMDDGARRTGSRTMANYKRYKSKFDSFNSISGASQEQRIRELRRNFFSPSDKAVGTIGTMGSLGAGAMTGNLGMAALGVGATAGLTALNKLMRERGSSTAARVAYRLYQVVDQLPTKYLAPLFDAAQKGGRNLELVDRLLRQNYPDYAAMMGEP